MKLWLFFWYLCFFLDQGTENIIYVTTNCSILHFCSRLNNALIKNSIEIHVFFPRQQMFACLHWIAWLNPGFCLITIRISSIPSIFEILLNRLFITKKKAAMVSAVKIADQFYTLIASFLTCFWLSRLTFMPNGVSKPMADSRPKGSRFQLDHLQVVEMQHWHLCPLVDLAV